MIRVTLEIVGPGSRVKVFDKSGTIPYRDWHGEKQDFSLVDVVTDDGLYTTYRRIDVCPLKSQSS